MPSSQPLTTDAPPTLADDLLWGVRAIAGELGIDRRRVYHMLQHGHLPASKIGLRWVASRSALRARFNHSVAQQAGRAK
jgi:Helix-turn-helix domain